MSDPEPPTGLATGSTPDVAEGEILETRVGDQSATSTIEEQWSETLPLLEETASVSKRRRVTGGVRIETRTELRQETAEVALNRQTVEVTRVPMNCLIEEAPEIRTEGDTMIIPVVEERLIVVKQLFLKEEVHIRHRTEREAVRENVELRRQRAVVRRVGPDGRIIEPEEPIAPDPLLAEP